MNTAANIVFFCKTSNNQLKKKEKYEGLVYSVLFLYGNKNDDYHSPSCPIAMAKQMIALSSSIDEDEGAI